MVTAARLRQQFGEERLASESRPDHEAAFVNYMACSALTEAFPVPR